MLAFSSVAEVLGLPSKAVPQSPIGLITQIEQGLPIGTVERMSNLVAPSDTQFKYRLVPRATYERRKSAKILSPEEGTRLARIARVWSLALEVWRDPNEARDFLFHAHPMIEDRRPIDVVIQSEFGAEMVLDILSALKYGSAA
ncbi:putative toxin-antitoxin system antitoxin component (TIGR02293 family) [Sinorhizobium kostiense]|uniref:Toxin-antitoxin system antitoxin component (TIGR02293 family) n=1 Tax=Sinorhizobium kostiense TaxID=76747 RepID=A0ABS4R2U6_9HYPH|nr:MULTISPECIES: antitoxin Xre-like helix-turn-helix domain-containing protein [Sinorhizobium]MBP2236625.1 putative toxin-antitoxin system antitoxin component (TIGR02293 family) [Sinorhizobium kostiense]